MPKSGPSLGKGSYPTLLSLRLLMQRGKVAHATEQCGGEGLSEDAAAAAPDDLAALAGPTWCASTS
jgi:hypothetical protein